MLLMSFSKKT